VFHISSILYCIFIFCIIVTNLALWLQDVKKLTYLLTYYTLGKEKSKYSWQYFTVSILLVVKNFMKYLLMT